MRGIITALEPFDNLTPIYILSVQIYIAESER